MFRLPAWAGRSSTRSLSLLSLLLLVGWELGVDSNFLAPCTWFFVLLEEVGVTELACFLVSIDQSITRRLPCPAPDMASPPYGKHLLK